MTAADRTAPRASGGVLFRLWLARLRIRRALVLHRLLVIGGIAAKMTPAQIAEAQRLAREWKPSGLSP